MLTEILLASFQLEAADILRQASQHEHDEAQGALHAVVGELVKRASQQQDVEITCLDGVPAEAAAAPGR